MMPIGILDYKQSSLREAGNDWLLELARNPRANAFDKREAFEEVRQRLKVHQFEHELAVAALKLEEAFDFEYEAMAFGRHAGVVEEFLLKVDSLREAAKTEPIAAQALKAAEELRELQEAVSPGRVAKPEYYVKVAKRLRALDTQIKPMAVEGESLVGRRVRCEQIQGTEIVEIKRRVKIMRELCEADRAYIGAMGGAAIVDASIRRDAARAAFRAMEAERNA